MLRAVAAPPDGLSHIAVGIFVCPAGSRCGVPWPRAAPPDPGPFDVAKLMPVAYVVAGIFVCFTLLVLIADVVNPVKIS